MPSPKKSHPIGRIRSAYRRLGMRDATAAGFARKLGCSDSLLRNVESGIFPLSQKLAKLIETETGVSAEWLLSNPGVDEPILDCDGNVWSPSAANKFSDEFEGVISRLYRSFPESLPAFVGAVIEAVLTLELPDLDSFQISTPDSMKKMDRFFDSCIGPVIQVVDVLDLEERERFFDTLKMHLGGRDAAASDKLLKLWDVLHSKNQGGTYLVKTPQVRAALPDPVGSSSRPQAMSKSRATKRGKD